MYMPTPIEQRLLRQKQIEDILKEECPILPDKALSLISYKTGLNKKKVREILIVLRDVDRIKLNENKEFIYVEDN